MKSQHSSNRWWTKLTVTVKKINLFGTPYALPPNHTQTSRYSYRPTPLVNMGVQASRKTLACGEHVSAQNCRRECSVQCYRRLQKVETPDVRWWRMDKQNAVCPYSGHYSAVKRGEALKECSDTRGLEKGEVREACPGGPHITEFCLHLSLHADSALTHVLKLICNPKIDTSIAIGGCTWPLTVCAACRRFPCVNEHPFHSPFTSSPAFSLM